LLHIVQLVVVEVVVVPDVRKVNHVHVVPLSGE
jgi:hypothetical protein